MAQDEDERRVDERGPGAGEGELTRREFLRRTTVGAAALTFYGSGAVENALAAPPTYQKLISTGRRSTPTPKRYVKPDRVLRFVHDLERRQMWPPSTVEPNLGQLTATPFLVIRNVENDDGTRPLSDLHLAQLSTSVQIIDESETPPKRVSRLAEVQTGKKYTLRCAVVNLGATASYFALADFYVAPRFVIDEAKTSATIPAADVLGHAGFIALPGETLVDCPNPWVPTPQTLFPVPSVLVHVYDPLLDLLANPFDWSGDRHVGLFNLHEAG